MSQNFLFIFNKVWFLLVITSFGGVLLENNTTIPFPGDDKCEKMGSLLLKHILEKTPLPDYLSDSYKLLKYSGSGLNDLGDYYACKTLPYSNYYTISIFMNSMSQSIGICYLKECSKDYIQNSLYRLYDYLNKTSPLPIQKEQIYVIDTDQELEKQRDPYWIGFYIVITITVLTLIVCLVGTFGKNKILESFNFVKNLKTIFSVHNQNEVFAHLRIFDGIRFLSAGWVVFGHTMYIPLLFGARNALEIYYQVKEWYFPFITSAYFSVDVFFYLSGFLFNFTVQKYFNKSIPRLKILLVSIVLRYFRLLPFLLVGVFGFIYVMPFFSDTPNMITYIASNKGCVNNFWHNLLYINNLVKYGSDENSKLMCSGHFWYLACDMQFFIASIIVVVFLNNQKLIRNIIFLVTLVGAIAFQIYLVYKNSYQYNDMIHPNGSEAFFFYDFYVKPYSRIVPYILGLFFCELLLETDLYKNEYQKKDYHEIPKKEDDSTKDKVADSSIDIDNSQKTSDENKKNSISKIYKFNKYIQNNNWFAIFLLIFSLILINVFFWTSSISNFNELSIFWSAFFNAFGKVLFILGLGTIVHLTFLDKFTFIRTLLTFRIESVISRSSYGIYVIHFFFIEFFTYGYENFYYTQFHDLCFLALGLFLFSWILSLFIGLLFESPVIVISKKLLRGGEKKQTQ